MQMFGRAKYNYCLLGFKLCIYQIGLVRVPHKNGKTLNSQIVEVLVTYL